MTPTVSWLLEVDVGIAEGASGDHVSAHPDGEHGAGLAELLEQHGLRDVGVQVSHVEGGDGVTRTACHCHCRLMYCPFVGGLQIQRWRLSEVLVGSPDEGVSFDDFFGLLRF